jgi:hypothetical protein
VNRKQACLNQAELCRERAAADPKGRDYWIGGFRFSVHTPRLSATALYVRRPWWTLSPARRWGFSMIAAKPLFAKANPNGSVALFNAWLGLERCEPRDRDFRQVISSTLKASIGRCKPLSVSSPTGSAVALPSRAARTLSSIKIWPSRASAQRRAARLTTVPIAL